jgi:tetratricopeptide (TPR) repeat protein
MTRRSRLVCVVAAIVIGAVAAAVYSNKPASLRPAPLVSAATNELTTTRAELAAAMKMAEERLASNPADGRAAATFAQSALRRARVESNGGYTRRAEQVLKAVLDREPGDYDALKMLGAVYMSQHRFHEAIDIATRAMRVHPADAWNYGVTGDAHLELGEYSAAFDAFDTMARHRPDAAAYGRIAYAQELQGHLDAAIATMRMAAEATGAQDPESLAWHDAQIGNLLLQTGDVDGAAREFARAEHVFPGHPFAAAGEARVAAARGQVEDALAMYNALMRTAPTSEIAVAAADLLSEKGDTAGAESMYARAEAIEREAWLTEARLTTNLARMLAERGIRINEAVRLAEEAARDRKDIFTMDALAWAYFRANRLADAEQASRQARRTGTADRRILAHADAIDKSVATLSRGPDTGTRTHRASL